MLKIGSQKSRRVSTRLVEDLAREWLVGIKKLCIKSRVKIKAISYESIHSTM
ncbi:MAG: hypothetical protein H3Z50_01650 [archaeon]|nr:hypothetical protein [archaeon]MCP8305586.1 hypothetical protein [archaeon]